GSGADPARARIRAPPCTFARASALLRRRVPRGRRRATLGTTLRARPGRRAGDRPSGLPRDDAQRGACVALADAARLPAGACEWPEPGGGGRAVRRLPARRGG